MNIFATQIKRKNNFKVRRFQCKDYNFLGKSKGNGREAIEVGTRQDRILEEKRRGL